MVLDGEGENRIHLNRDDPRVYPVCEETPISGHSEVWIAINKDKEGKKCTI